MRITKLSRRKHSIALESAQHLHLLEVARLLQQQILGPISAWNLVNLLVEICEAGCGGTVFEGGLGVHVFAGFCGGGAGCGTPAADERFGGSSAIVAVEVDFGLGLLDPAAGEEVLVGLVVEVCPLLIGGGS